MVSKFGWESSVFNPFSVKDNLIHNEVDLDVNFFQCIFLLLTPNITLPLKWEKALKTPRMYFLFFMSILEVWKRTLKTLEIFIYYGLDFTFSIICFSETLADFVKIPFINLKTITWYTRYGVVTKDENSVSLLMNLSVTIFTKICALIIMTLNHLL